MLTSAPTEHQEQVIVCQWLDIRHRRYFAIPNAGKRKPWQAQWLKSEGMKAGVPDLVIIGNPMIALEMKRERGGKLSDEQIEWHSVLRNVGWTVIVARGATEAIRMLTGLGV